MFIRYNGLLDGQPSFTTLYSRCAHLGCPVQPNGPVEDEQKKTYGDNVDLIPVLAVGFGCPCHGGQYDTEGNRTAGPPVRALDRAEFSIIDGNLFLGELLQRRRGRGRRCAAPGSRSTAAATRASTSTAPSAWLYPLEVPQ